jgi:hypothetical protein
MLRVTDTIPVQARWRVWIGTSIAIVLFYVVVPFTTDVTLTFGNFIIWSISRLCDTIETCWRVWKLS